MLGARTKQVYAYGKRSQRIVNVSDSDRHHDLGNSTFGLATERVQDHTPPRKPAQRIASKSKITSPKAIAAQRRKQLSPKSIKKPTTRVKHLAESEQDHRRPLVAYSPNLPGSPAVSTITRKASANSRLPGLKSSNLKAAFSPFVDLDITVVDGNGKIVKKERRKSRTDIQTNPVGNSKATSKKMTRPVVITLPPDSTPGTPTTSQSTAPKTKSRLKNQLISTIITISSDEEEDSPAPARRRNTRMRSRPVLISDDDDDSDTDGSADGSFHLEDSSSDDGDVIEDSPLPVRRTRSRRLVVDSESEDTSPSSSNTVYPPCPSPTAARRESSQKPILSVDIPLRSSKPSVQSPVHSPPQPPSVIKSTVPLRASKFPGEKIAPITSATDSTSRTPIRFSLHDQLRLVKVKPFEYVASPIPRPRKLTPIRRPRHINANLGQPFPRPPSPPSPTTPTDFDLSCNFSSLSLGADFAFDYTPPPHLIPLLEECSQLDTGPYEFSSFINTFPFDPVVACGTGDKVEFRKIGEASYSEVFGIGDVVLKIVPLKNEGVSASANDADDGPAPSDASDVLKEIIVTRAMGDVSSAFVKLLKTYVVRGRYPELLLNLWDEYDSKKGSESVRPDTFAVSQTYAIIVLPNGGPDLEAYVFSNAAKTGWKHACSLFWQVVKALAKAEEFVRFEHRDLHWGQILIKNTPLPLAAKILATKRTANTLPGMPTTGGPKDKMMDHPTHGVTVTLIDLGLARMDAGDGQDGRKVHWTHFDEEVFLGEGDYQFDVYRLMKTHNRNSWEEFRPLTNVLWLHYLSLKLLKDKRLKPPRKSTTNVNASGPNPSSAIFAERDCYESLVEMEKLLAKSVAFVKRETSKSKANGSAGLKGPASAIEVVAYGVKRLWVQR